MTFRHFKRIDLWQLYYISAYVYPMQQIERIMQHFVTYPHSVSASFMNFNLYCEGVYPIKRLKVVEN